MSWIKEQFTEADLQRMLTRLAAHVKAFQGLTPAEISEVLSKSEKCSFPADAYIVKEGNIGSHMYIILGGEARVFKDSRDGPLVLARLIAADSFGEMALADNEARSASVKADSDCVLVRINDKVINSRPEIGLKVYRNIAKLLSSRLREADELLAWRL